MSTRAIARPLLATVATDQEVAIVYSTIVSIDMLHYMQNAYI